MEGRVGADGPCSEARGGGRLDHTCLPPSVQVLGGREEGGYLSDTDTDADK